MFNYIWNNHHHNVTLDIYSSKYEVIGIVPILWDEHCVECAMPFCYGNCAKFKARRDKRCLRFDNGIEPVDFSNGVLRGATISFREWAKLEGDLPKFLNCIDLHKMDKIDKRFNKIAQTLESLSQIVQWGEWKRPSRFIMQYWERYYFYPSRMSRDNKQVADGFLATMYNHESRLKKIHVEIYEDNQTRKTFFHKAMILTPGWNEDFTPLIDMNISNENRCRIKVYFDGNEKGILTFKMLDFVQIKQNISVGQPAKKVKCVAWDLDNTLWEGVIGDAGQDGVVVKQDSMALIKRLDEMGVIQTITSKNNFDLAWQKIVSLGLGDYFIYPAINWGRKSQSMIAIAKGLNINIDTFALIDDSAFERDEVRFALPQTRQYDVSEINSILSYPEFDLPITEESKNRRQSYMIEAKRKNILSSWAGDYDAFLKECNLKMQVFTPSSEEDISRCAELLQRSNQYNISRNRHDAVYIAEALKSELYRPLSYIVSDKFGNYGIVGFCCFKMIDGGWQLVDFVMSCRVAQKKVERALFKYVTATMKKEEILSLVVEKTDRNMPLCDELRKLPFENLADNQDVLKMQYIVTNSPLIDESIIEVIEGKI